MDTASGPVAIDVGVRKLTPSELSAILSELKRRLSAFYGDRLVRIILYGSQARGDAEAGSDIDVLVVLKGPVQPIDEIERTTAAVGELSLDRNVAIACLFRDEGWYEHDGGPLFINVRREGVTM
jgi:predicted nucleotidyltransferase